MDNLLEVKNLKVIFSTHSGMVNAVNDVSFTISIGETLVLAGESGSGKSVSALALTRILPENARIISGGVTFLGRDLLDMDEIALTAIRGKEIAYIFQEPVSFLNPVYTIGNQIAEAIMLHQGRGRQQAYNATKELLSLVKIKDPQRVIDDYPHQLSGGMNQRAFIAMSLACKPKLLIADEPTTSLDVTIEAQILKLLVELKKEIGFSLLFITHNLSIAKKISDKICIMYQGKIVEQGSRDTIFNSPSHFHTQALIRAYEKIGKI